MFAVLKPSSNGSPDTQPQEEAVVGQRLPASILDIVLRATDRQRISLREILDDSGDGILVCVHTKGSKKRRRSNHRMGHVFSMSDMLSIVYEDAARFFGSKGYPHISLTCMGLTAYPPRVNAALAALPENVISVSEPPLVLSDQKALLLGPMGYVRPPAASKAWEKRFNREGPIRRGFFLVKKDSTLYARRTGTMPNMTVQIARVQSRFHKEWSAERRRRGIVVQPW